MLLVIFWETFNIAQSTKLGRMAAVCYVLLSYERTITTLSYKISVHYQRYGTPRLHLDYWMIMR
ncbi:hypothetical protein HanLR1_Chr16g0612891 [Helianthus annuus]|nr:hypothetical protein HanLR1_Chr16g0612891 [Helianthus annuus]